MESILLNLENIIISNSSINSNKIRNKINLLHQNNQISNKKYFKFNDLY